MVQTPEIAFVTCEKLRNDESGDIKVIREFVENQKLGLNISRPVWNDPVVKWDHFDLIVLDTTWDYHLNPEDFRKWLDDLENNNLTVINPSRLVQWNMDKKYLFELWRKKFRIPKSLIIKKKTPMDQIIEKISVEFNSEAHSSLIVKPTISASSYKTAKVNHPISKNGQKIISDIIDECDLLVQEYLELIKDGEYSIIFFNGQYTHSILKTPKSGEFRSQSEFGGSVEKVDPPPRLIDFADRLLDEFPLYPTYARIDVVYDGVSGILMECELIEPYLFLSESEHGTKILIDALLSKINLS